MSALDTSAEAGEALARRLGGVPLDMTVAEFDEAAALLRALLRERDEARAQSRMWQEACGEHGGRYWEARCRDAEAARDTAEAALATARADALREALGAARAATHPLPSADGIKIETAIFALINQPTKGGRVMHDTEIIEAMARAAWDSQWPDFPWDADEYEGSADCRKATEAALTALCAARPDVAALLRGEAVAVPKKGTPEINRAIHGAIALHLEPWPYAVEVAASPWAQEETRDE